MDNKTDLELGKVNIHHEVISTIASKAACTIPGVVRMSGSIVENIAEKLGKRTQDKGIRTEVVGEEVKIDVSVILLYGTKIPDIAWQIQKNVRKAIEELTGLHVMHVNVNVEGVQDKDNEKEEKNIVKEEKDEKVR